jgi:S1-C subfamily serine protease
MRAFQEPQLIGNSMAFFTTGDGYLVTNNHVVNEATKVRLVTSAGLIDAKVVQVDAANDLALLKAGGRFAPLPIATSRTVSQGGTVATVGFPDIGFCRGSRPRCWRTATWWKSRRCPGRRVTSAILKL